MGVNVRLLFAVANLVVFIGYSWRVWLVGVSRHFHCALAVVRRSPKFSPRRRPPSRRRGTAKILPAGDGHYLYLQTQLGEDRCTQFRVIVVTDPQSHTQRPPARCKQTGPITIHCAAKLSVQQRNKKK